MTPPPMHICWPLLHLRVHTCVLSDYILSVLHIPTDSFSILSLGVLKGKATMRMVCFVVLSDVKHFVRELSRAGRTCLHTAAVTRKVKLLL